MGMTTGSSGGARGRRVLQSEINVTPFVDVMLVLLIVFMITAPLLTKGIDVSLPKTDADALSASDDPLTVAVDVSGQIYIGSEQPIELAEIGPRLRAVSGENPDIRIFLRGDEGVSYGRITQVLSAVTGSGFTNVALVTDPRYEEDAAQR
ncbi:MAG: ExbD/TolR family protein [Pseudomonadota bacterium]